MHPTFRIAVACLLTLLAACSPPNRGEGQSQEQIPLGQLPDTVEPARYRLDLTIEPDKPRFGGIVEIDVTLKNPSRWCHRPGVP
jgi:hypothetical protein